MKSLTDGEQDDDYNTALVYDECGRTATSAVSSLQVTGRFSLCRAQRAASFPPKDVPQGPASQGSLDLPHARERLCSARPRATYGVALTYLSLLLFYCRVCVVCAGVLTAAEESGGMVPPAVALASVPEAT